MQIWVVITSSLIHLGYEQRKIEYNAGIQSVLDLFKDPKYKIIIVENNSSISNPFSYHTTFLNKFNVPVVYTKHNILNKQTKNYGIMEMMDIKYCIQHFQIPDDDFIVKVTGRYILDKESPFVKVIQNLENKPYSAVVRFGQFDEPFSLVKTNNCTTGIIGLKCKYVKQIEIPELSDTETSIEMKWAKMISTLDDSEIYFLETLGLYIKPKCIYNLNYFYI